MFRTISATLSVIIVAFVLLVGLAGPASAATAMSCSDEAYASKPVCAVAGHPQFVTADQIVVPAQQYEDMRIGNEAMTQVIPVLFFIIAILLISTFAPILVRMAKEPIEVPLP